MSTSQTNQQLYRSKKSLTKDFVTEECDRLIAEDFEESISQGVKVELPSVPYWNSSGVKANRVKVFQSFDNILTYDKGQVSMNNNLQHFEFLGMIGSSDHSVISVGDLSPASDEEQKESISKRLQGSCSKRGVNYTPPKEISYWLEREDSVEEASNDNRLPSVVILKKLQLQKMLFKK